FAWSRLAAGNTLIVRNGTYTSASPPAAKSGTAGSVITVQAENDGGAVISGGLSFKGNAFLSFEGLRVTGSGTAINIVSNGPGAVSHDLIFRRIGWNCTDTTLNDAACFQMSDGTHDVLVEDSWGWGG